MARFTSVNFERARELMGHYPRARSAMIPMCHLAQEQDGYLTQDAMEQIAEMIGGTPAEVYGTASFYEMFKFHPVGKYLVGVCTNISCLILGGEELLDAGLGKDAVVHGGIHSRNAVNGLVACAVSEVSPVPIS